MAVDGPPVARWPAEVGDRDRRAGGGTLTGPGRRPRPAGRGGHGDRPRPGDGRTAGAGGTGLAASLPGREKWSRWATP